ncbi:hypothetical protein JW948_16785 [bacterium]|nr:hypothetical protein [bacterium]
MSKALRLRNEIVIDHSRLKKVKAKMRSVNAACNPDHDATRPLFTWFQDTPAGKELFIALYTQKCEWAKCSFCALPSVSSPGPVNFFDVLRQVDYAFDSLDSIQTGGIRRVFLSNNGSIFNTRTMPDFVLDQICENIHMRCPHLKIIEFETRFEYVTRTRVLDFIRKMKNWHAHFLCQGIRHEDKPVAIQLSAGYETQDPFLRNDVLCKGYSESDVQQSYEAISRIRKETGADIRIDENVLLKPAPGMTADEAIRECYQTILHIFRLGSLFELPVSVRLNPTFVAVGSLLHEKFMQGEYTPPVLNDVIRVLGMVRDAGIDMPLFVGLNEEALDVPDGSFNQGSDSDRHLIRRLKRWNATQDFSVLEPVPCEAVL